MKPLTSFIDSPLGFLEIVSDGSYLVKAEFSDNYDGSELVVGKVAEKVKRELREYFNGKRKKFTVKLKPDNRISETSVG